MLRLIGGRWHGSPYLRVPGQREGRDVVNAEGGCMATLTMQRPAISSARVYADLELVAGEGLIHHHGGRRLQQNAVQRGAHALV